MSTLTLEPRLYRPAPAGSDRSARTTSTAIRLTQRGRLLIVATALLVAFVVGVFVAAAGSAASERPGIPSPTRIVQVHDGDTLWDVARGVARGGDVRASMAEIEQLNAMDSTDLRVGQRLVVPAR